MKKEKYFLIYLKTGGGHLAPARSITNYLQKHHGDEVEVELVNGFEETSEVARYLIEDGYRILQAKAKWYYEMLYFTNKFILIGYLNRYLLQFNMDSYLEKKILADKPDKVIVFHFFCYASVYRIIKKHNLNIKVITIVTDPFTVHPLWTLRKEQNFIVFSDRVKEDFISKGISAEVIHTFPFILEEKFNSKIPPEQIKALKMKYGFDMQKKVLLLLGGGDGVPKGLKMLKALIKSGFEHNIAIVCGNNNSLFSDVEKLIKVQRLTNIKVYGYINFVYELLNISDAVVTKCGASTIMEILHIGKVPLIIDYLWEQEKGNVEYVTDNKMGLFQRDVDKIPALVKRLFNDNDYYNSFVKNIENQNLVNGTKEVSDFIKNF